MACKRCRSFDRKIVRKRCESKVARKYQDISVENYKSVITDLIGVRAIHLFKNDWYNVHQHILSNWKPNERVTVYFRDGDNIAMFSGHKCKTVKHKAGYRSIHYIIPVNKIDNNKIACEIQTRTLFEEGWSEIDHRVRYPNFLDDENLKKYLDIFNRLAGSADEMGSYVNSLVELINLNQEYNFKIHLLEGEVDKLLQENAEAEVIRKAFKELKNTYEMKEELFKQERYIINGKKNVVSNNIRSIVRYINDKNIDVNSLNIKNFGSGAHVTLSDKNGQKITLPTFYIKELEQIFNVKIK
ncbi:hypothetical protein MMP66_16930 [Acinetobacter dispersus]|uniref:hypothetical protein n=1 Tax=Acinetobacter dispersus TaxID=70348 RepID=UPI001F4A7D47|nr:hypothetical protein [Acinetobacter dispersus]MCH7395938.1 hypothetical protein [Acinetobacter dispersus]